MSSTLSRRRTLRAGGVALTTVLTGCSDTLLGRENEVVRRKFALLEFGTSAEERAPEVHEPPSVEFDAESNSVTLTGSLYVGSGSCSKAVVKRVNYDRESDKLRAVVGSGPKGLWGRIGLGCTGDMSADTYRVTVEFSDRVPETVVAVEKQGERSQTTTARLPDSD